MTESEMEKQLYEMTLPEFAGALGSRAPVPGGGGAAALTGALAAALASMVCELTRGKKRYAQFGEDIARITGRAEKLCVELLTDIDEDAAAFEPLSRAYAIPRDDPERARIMEKALKNACAAPMGIARRCGEVLELLSELSEKGSAIAVSDVGVGAQLARAALLSAGLNVRINVSSMSDRAAAGALSAELAALEEKYVPMAEDTYRRVVERIG